MEKQVEPQQGCCWPAGHSVSFIVSAAGSTAVPACHGYRAELFELLQRLICAWCGRDLGGVA